MMRRPAPMQERRVPAVDPFDPSNEEILRSSIQDVKDMIGQLSTRVDMMQGFLKVLEVTKQGKEGPQGEQGIQGEKPTERELLTIIRPLVPKVEDITPSQEEINAVIKENIVQPLDGKDGISPEPQEVALILADSEKLHQHIENLIKSALPNKEIIIGEITAEMEKKGISLPEIQKIETRFAEIRSQIAQGSAPYNPPPGSKRGGGDTVVAGSGIVITNTVNGNKQISASGTAAAWKTPPETPNGVTTAFTVTSEPTEVVADGATLFDGAGYTYAALTITFVNPPAIFVRYQSP